MPTHMSAFADIAARYGIDPNDEESVDRFFDEQAPSLSEPERATILDELFARQGDDGQSPARKRYAKGAPDPQIHGRQAVPVALRAVDPARDAAELSGVAQALRTGIKDFLVLSGLDVIVDIETAGDGRLDLVVHGPSAQRLRSDENELLESIRFLVKRVASAQQVIADADVIVHGDDDLGTVEDTGGAKLRVVRMENIPIEAMSVRLAAAALHTSANEFIVFRDEETNHVSVLYKRRDRELGLIS